VQNDGDVLVNEELGELMKWTDGAVGKRLHDLNQAGTIVGVFRNVRNTTFLQQQYPVALICSSVPNHAFDVRLKQPYDENLKKLNEYMEQVYPTRALEFVSIDTMLEHVYSDVRRFRNSVWITSLFILFIVIMGLIGYVNDETQRRSKEIAIRKVNGAEVSTILRLLSRDILYVVIPSALIGTVASYFTAGAWLDQFPEAIDMNPLYFAAMCLGVIVLVVVCVIIKAWRIANENPVKSIKTE
ncbi:MAG: ABC transporter permease, partial [Phocaeicola sp.]|nr:ABC transporter permease [Phocaeicola sp.]